MKNILSIPANSSVLADTGFWVALGARRDPYHVLCRQVAGALEYDPVTTWPVITETCYLLQKMEGLVAVQQFLEGVERARIAIFHLDESRHVRRIRQLMEQYRKLPMDLAGASMVILAEELGHGRILSTDQRDFNAYRWKNHKPFTNLLFPHA